MGRRDLIVLISALTTLLSFGADAQQSTRRIAVLMPYVNDETAQTRLSQFRKELELLGWRDGASIRIEEYFANSDLGLIRTYASKVVASAPDVIFAATPPVVAVLSKQTRSIPIVFTNITDPVGVGLVDSLGHPGANVTGFGAYDFSVAGKWVALLKQVAPALTRVGVIQMPQHATNAKLFKAAEEVASSIKLDPFEIAVRTAPEIELALRKVASQPGTGLVVLPSPITPDHHDLIVRLAAQYKLPAVYPYRDLAEGGGLMSYGQHVEDGYKNAATYVDRILKGEKPANLPVQAPSRFELIVDLKAALITMADEVIE